MAREIVEALVDAFDAIVEEHLMSGPYPPPPPLLANARKAVAQDLEKVRIRIEARY